MNPALRPSMPAAMSHRPVPTSPPGTSASPWRALWALALAILPALGETKLPEGFSREVLVGPSIREPMDMAFAPDGSAWITARGGELWRLEPQSRHLDRIGKVETDTAGDRGLHGIAFHPDFPATPRVFLFLHAPKHPPGEYRSRVVAHDVTGAGTHTRLAPGEGSVLLEFGGDEGAQHVGGGLLAHPVERALYVTTGDNNKIWELKSYGTDTNNRAQSIADLRGKVLRIGLDGSIPASNPFAKVAGARGEVFTRGHRQPWSLSYDPPTRWVLLAENGGDEQDDHERVLRLAPGANHGWPRVFADGLDTLTRTNRVPGFEPPWFSYRRGSGGSCTGGLIYRAPSAGGGFPSAWHGGLFYADYNRKSVRFAPIDASTRKPGPSVAFAQSLPGGPVAMRLGPDGSLYLVEYGGWFQATTNDAISRITYARR